MECIFARDCGGTGPYSEGGARENLNIYSIVVFTTMGNIWGSEKIRTVNGTYLDDRPRWRQRQKPLEEPLLEGGAPPPKEHWKEKALRIIHYVAERSRTFNRDMLLQTEG